MDKKKKRSDSSEEECDLRGLNKKMKRLEKYLTKLDRQTYRSRSPSSPVRRDRERGYGRSPDSRSRSRYYDRDSDHSYDTRYEYRGQSVSREKRHRREYATERKNTPQEGTSEPRLQAGPALESIVNTATTAEITSNDSPDGEGDKKNNLPEIDSQKEKDLDVEVLQALGDRLIPDRVFEPAMRKDLAIRLQEVVTKGLPAEERKSLLAKFNLPENGLFMDPPKLVFEFKARLQNAIVKKDTCIVEKQERIAACFAGLLKLMSLILQISNDNIAMVEIASGVLGILADLQHEESAIRRSLVLKNIGASMRNTLNTSTGVDDWLFSKELEEKVKAVKMLEFSSKRLKPKSQQKPKYICTWDTSLVLNCFRKWGPSDELTLEKLSLKLVTLLAITTGYRTQTLSSIDVRYVYIAQDAISIMIPDTIQTSGANKVQPLLSLPFWKSEIIICPASTMEVYLKKTKELRNDENNLFVSWKNPHRAVSSQSLSRWIKRVLADSGVDTSIFSAGHASTSMAHKNGVGVDCIRKTAGWTSSSITFARFYQREHAADDKEFNFPILHR